MQDRYVGDVGDFGKYGMLKALSRDDLSLGVVWYLTPDEGASGDGSLLWYLRQEQRYMPCDPALFHVLYRMIRDGDRSVRAVREHGVLPRGTVFYEERLSYADMPGAREGRPPSDAWSTARRGPGTPWLPPGGATWCSSTPTTA